MSASRPRWKRREREAARLPNTGRASPDIVATVGGQRLAVEHKSRASLPGWLLDAVAQAERNAPEGALPVVLLSAGAGPGRPLHRLAVVRLSDLPPLLAAAAGADGGFGGPPFPQKE